jgi:HK97 family phage major capsid protein
VTNVYGTSISRTSGQADALVPEPLATSIIEELPRSSAALSLMQRTTLSSKTQRIPVLDILPVSYWVSGDTGMKQTTFQGWKNVVLVVEELATIVPIPQAYMDDADMPIWSAVQPRMVESAGALIDSAVLFGVNKPATWGESVFVGCKKTLQFVKAGTGVDYGVDVSNLAQKIVQAGYNPAGAAAMPGLSWKLVGIRSAQGVPIYEPDLQGGDGNANGRLYGRQLAEIDNGSWNATATGAEVLLGDWSKSMIGVRQDISFKLFTEGVVSNDSGKVILNLMQQDAVAMRMVMRLAYAVVNPVTILNPGSSITARWPFGAILPASATSPQTAAALTQMTSYATAGAYTGFDPSSLAGLSDEQAVEHVQQQHAVMAAQAADYADFLKERGVSAAQLRRNVQETREAGAEQGALPEGQEETPEG